MVSTRALCRVSRLSLLFVFVCVAQGGGTLWAGPTVLLGSSTEPSSGSSKSAVAVSSGSTYSVSHAPRYDQAATSASNWSASTWSAAALRDSPFVLSALGAIFGPGNGGTLGNGTLGSSTLGNGGDSSTSEMDPFEAFFLKFAHSVDSGRLAPSATSTDQASNSSSSSPPPGVLGDIIFGDFSLRRLSSSGSSSSSSGFQLRAAVGGNSTGGLLPFGNAGAGSVIVQSLDSSSLALTVGNDAKEKIVDPRVRPPKPGRVPEAPTVLLFVTGILGLGLWKYKSLRSLRWGTAS